MKVFNINAVAMNFADQKYKHFHGTVLLPHSLWESSVNWGDVQWKVFIGSAELK